MLSMAKLVYHDAVDHIIRQQHQQTVEIQIALAGAAAPAASLGPDGDLIPGDAHPGGVERHPARKVLLCPLFQLGQLFCRQLGQRGPAFVFGQFATDPAFLTGHKIPDGPVGHPLRSPDQQGAVGPDLQGNGLPLAPDQGIGNVQENHLRDEKRAVLPTAPTQSA